MIYSSPARPAGESFGACASMSPKCFWKFSSACLSMNSGACQKLLNKSVLSVFQKFTVTAKRLKMEITFLS